MFNIIKKEIEWAGRKLTIETGRIARQANASVFLTYGETTILCNATANEKPSDVDFFPLVVNYQEKAYAGGKIPGGFFKREGKNSEKETLTSRLIDRPIRPLFPKNFKNETQVICTVLSHDKENDADIPALIAASAALTISDIPFEGPIAAAKIGIIGDEYVVNPTIEELKTSLLDITVAGTKDSILMVESQASELSEDEMLEALKIAQESFAPIIQLISELKDEAGKEKWATNEEDSDADALQEKIAKEFASKIEEAYKITEKLERKKKLSEIFEAVAEKFAENEEDAPKVTALASNIEKKIVRGKALNKERIDGRAPDEIRPIDVQVSVLPRVHGSALFTRGETQSLTVLTLGTADDEQIIDSIEGDRKDKFMLHYNFPPYCVGEVQMLRPPGRREIGHGRLARKAITHILPQGEEFNYTIRLVSEVTESNGSSSMATVCASSLALMDGGVPTKKAVAGIAMGLVKEDDNYVVLSDIMGDEDHLGDMDFKVAGTVDGITALQMDIKIPGITFEIFQNALEQAKKGRMHILDKMNNAINKPSEQVNEHAPSIETFKIPEFKIKDVIGQGGKVIKRICEEFSVKVFIEDSGSVSVSGVGRETVDAAVSYINGLIEDPVIGKIYKGKVDRITDYGAFVGFLTNAYGMIHISEFSEERIESVEEFVKVGDEIELKVIGKDGDKFRLSYKAVAEGEDENPPSNDDSNKYNRRNHRGGGGGGRHNNRKRHDNRRNDRGDRNRDKNGNRHEKNNDTNGNTDKPKKKRKFFW